MAGQARREISDGEKKNFYKLFKNDIITKSEM